VRLPNRVLLTALSELLRRKLQDRLKHPVPRSARLGSPVLLVHLPDQTLVNQIGDAVEDGDGRVGRRETGVGS